jgi:hypothetical protein
MWIATVCACYPKSLLPKAHTRTHTHALARTHTHALPFVSRRKTAFVDSQCEATRDSLLEKSLLSSLLSPSPLSL